MHEAPGDDDGTETALFVAVERERAVAKRGAVPRLNARTRRHRAALIANGWIRIRLLLSQRNDAASGCNGTEKDCERGRFPHRDSSVP
jgi:hypothetical protein